MQRNYRVERPGRPDRQAGRATVWESRGDALDYAREWAAINGALYLVWDFGAAMYIARFDGRPTTPPLTAEAANAMRTARRTA